jgi:uncharacterized cupredoxin-like copper-binding protein
VVALRLISSALLLAALAACLTACGAGHLLTETGRVVDVSERDFSINVSTQHLAPGLVTFRVTNHGPDDHELIVIRERRSRLPLRTDGITVNEGQLKPETVGALEPSAPGAVRDLTVRLTKGRYVLLCNMSGHFMGGMHAVVVVS